MSRIYCLLLISLAATAAHAEIYKWVDEDGVTHYGQKPPAGRDSDEVGTVSTAPSQGTRTVPPQVQEAAEGLTAAILSNDDPASTLDCSAAVENARYSIDSMLEVGRKNVKDGYMDKAEYDQTAAALKQVRRSVSVSECNSAKGSVRDFYLCMSNGMNHIVACGEKHNYEP